LKRHALALKKDDYTTYHNPSANLVAKYRMWELFQKALKQAERKKLPDVVNRLKPVESKKLLTRIPPLIDKTYCQAFQFLKDKVRDLVSHGGGSMADGEFANYDNPKLFLECVRYVEAVADPSNEVFETLMTLPHAFEVEHKPR